MARKKRRRRSREFWLDMVSCWEKSGLTVTAFCEEEGLAPSTFALWRRRLADEGGQETLPALPTLLPVEVVGRLAADQGCEILLPGDRRVHVGPGFDEETLRRVLTCLEGLRC